MRRAAGFLLHWHRKALQKTVNLAKASVFLSLQALHKLANRLFNAVCIWRFMKLLVLWTWIRIPLLIRRPHVPIFSDMGRLAYITHQCIATCSTKSCKSLLFTYS